MYIFYLIILFPTTINLNAAMSNFSLLMILVITPQDAARYFGLSLAYYIVIVKKSSDISTIKFNYCHKLVSSVMHQPKIQEKFNFPAVGFPKRTSTVKQNVDSCV